MAASTCTLDGTVPREQLADYRGDPERAGLLRTSRPNYTVFATNTTLPFLPSTTSTFVGR